MRAPMLCYVRFFSLKSEVHTYKQRMYAYSLETFSARNNSFSFSISLSLYKKTIQSYCCYGYLHSSLLNFIMMANLIFDNQDGILYIFLFFCVCVSIYVHILKALFA